MHCPPAVTNCSYHNTCVQCSVIRPFLWLDGGLELNTYEIHRVSLTALPWHENCLFSFCWHTQHLGVFAVVCDINLVLTLTSVLWRCWFGGRKGIWPVKNWVVGCWHGYLSGARCRLAYGPADAIATHCLLLQIGFTFLVPAYPVSPRQRAVKQVCVTLTVHLLREKVHAACFSGILLPAYHWFLVILCTVLCAG